VAGADSRRLELIKENATKASKAFLEGVQEVGVSSIESFVEQWVEGSKAGGACVAGCSAGCGGGCAPICLLDTPAIPIGDVAAGASACGGALSAASAAT